MSALLYITKLHTCHVHAPLPTLADIACRAGYGNTAYLSLPYPAR